LFRSDVPLGEAAAKSQEWQDVLRTCEDDRRPGLLMRTPKNEGGYEGPDNITAVLNFDHRHKTGFAKRFLEYGEFKRTKALDSFKHEDKESKKNYSRALYYPLKAAYGCGGIPWVYNNMEPRRFHTSAWIGRQWQVIVQAKMIDGMEELNGYDRWRWKIAVGSAVGGDTQDGWALSSNLVLSRDTQYEDLNLCAEEWHDGFRKSKYKLGGMGQVLAHYWQRATWENPDYDKARESHPTIDLLWGEFGQ